MGSNWACFRTASHFHRKGKAGIIYDRGRYTGPHSGGTLLLQLFHPIPAFCIQIGGHPFKTALDPRRIHDPLILIDGCLAGLGIPAAASAPMVSVSLL